jgi:uncharacterized membrane protein
MPEQKNSPNQIDQDILDNKVMAALSYIWILFLIPLLLKRDSKFCQFHAKQGLILFVFSFITWFPVIGWLIALAIIVASVMGVVKTLAGESWRIPLVYGLSEKINL